MHQTTCEPIAASLARKALALLLAVALAFSTFIMPVSSGSQEAHAAQGNTLVVAIDPGHGGSDPGALGDGFQEKAVNWAIALACANELSTYSGVKVVLTRGEDEYIALDERVRRATSEGADVVVSMHCNSYSGTSANGVETYVPNESTFNYETTRVPGYALGSKIQAALVALGFKDRGVKKLDSSSMKYADGSVADYYTIIYNSRLAGIPGLIVEHGFITNPTDAAKLKDPTWQVKLGIADATAIAEFYGLSKVPTNGSAVATGNVQKLGEAVSTPRSYQDDPSIMGATALSTAADADVRRAEAVAKMAAWYKATGHAYPANVTVTREDLTYQLYKDNGAPTIEDFCAILYEEAVAENIRPEVVFAQAMKETGWLQFGGQVKNYQCNFCGLGAVDGSNGGSADFGLVEVNQAGEDDSAAQGGESEAAAQVDDDGAAVPAATLAPNPNGVRMGLRAQVQHLKAYADSTAAADKLANPCIDPRFDLVDPKGKAPTVGGLSGTWASDTGYGASLTTMINGLLGFKNSEDAVAVDLTGIESLSGNLAAGDTTTVYVNGVAATMTIAESGGGAEGVAGELVGTLPIAGSEPQSIVMYEHRYPFGAEPFDQYPTAMYTWLVRAENGKYVTQRYYGLDNLMMYSGCSIRVTGNKGIRMITGISSNVKTALAGSGINGYTLVETGTLLAWSSAAPDEGPTLDTLGVSRGRAYVKGSTNPVLYTQNGIEYYTNVLVGDFTAEHCKASLAMRPYVILADSAGKQFVVYGGVVHRSIGHIAGQNANAFPQGTAAYNYVHSIIDACK